MMPTIRVDDEVWAFLQSKATPLEDTPNDVLRRELFGSPATRSPEFSPEDIGYNYQKYDRNKVRSLCIALGDSFHREDVKDFSQRLMHELCDEGSPKMTSDTFWQLSKWCKTAGAFKRGMGHAQNISRAVFGRVIERR